MNGIIEGDNETLNTSNTILLNLEWENRTQKTKKMEPPCYTRALKNPDLQGASCGFCAKKLCRRKTVGDYSLDWIRTGLLRVH